MPEKERLLSLMACRPPEPRRGHLRLCSGDLATQSFPSSYLVTGTNTLTVNRTGATRTAGSYGVVEVARLHLVSGVWRIQNFLATGNYGSGNLTLTWSL